MRHPLVEFVKFLAAIVLLCLTRNPYVSVLFLILEFVIAPSVKSVLALLGMMESLAYGVFAGVQLWLLCRWTYRMGRAMTSEKMVIVFKYLFPPAAIVLSMAIRSVNRYTDKLVEIYHFQMSMEPARGLWNRMISAIRSISILINWALENGLEIADAMECRAYGSKLRTSYTPFRLLPADILIMAAFVGIVVLQRVSEPFCLLIPRIEIHFGVANIFITLALCALIWWQTEREEL